MSRITVTVEVEEEFEWNYQDQKEVRVRQRQIYKQEVNLPTPDSVRVFVKEISEVVNK